AEARPRALVRVFFDKAAMRPNEKIVEIHALNLGAQILGQASAKFDDGGLTLGLRAVFAGVKHDGRRLSERLDRLGRRFSFVDLADQLHARVEQALRQRLADGAVGGAGVLVEELEVATPVEDVEERLVPAGSEQVLAQP